MWTWLMNFLGLNKQTETVVVPVVTIENKDEVVNTVVIQETIEDEVLPILETSQPETTVSTATDLNSMKKDELLALAKEKGLKANASMNKQALIALING
jgi:hypothetical protein